MKLVEFIKSNSIRKMINCKLASRDDIDIDLWGKKFRSWIPFKDERLEELLEEFLSCELEWIQGRVSKKNQLSPLLICVVRNDISRIKKFMDYYRSLGIEQFIFVDNDSTDGTFELLCDQSDAIIYRSKQKYSSTRRIAWINKILSIYGIGKWYLVVDSDEFITYIGAEKNSIQDMVQTAMDRGYDRVEGFLVDMYPVGQPFCSNDFMKENCWFDTNSYDLTECELGCVITGGPRKRIFNKVYALSKYPLFYFDERTFLPDSHYLLPVKKVPIALAMCHYKFVDSVDYDKMKDAVISGQYSNNSADYKSYLEKFEQGNISFYSNEHSAEMINSSCLSKIDFIESFF